MPNIDPKDVEVPELGDIGKYSGIFDIESVDLAKEVHEEYQKVFDKERSFWDRVGSFLRAENKAGRWAKVVKDFALVFIPYGKTIDNITDLIITDKKQKQMAQLKEGTFQKIIRFLKQESTRRGLAFVAGLVGAWLSIDLQPELLIQSAIGVISGLSLIYAAWQNIKGIFIDEDNP